MAGVNTDVHPSATSPSVEAFEIQAGEPGSVQDTHSYTQERFTAQPRPVRLAHIGFLACFTAVEAVKGVLSAMALHGKRSDVVQSFVVTQGIISLLSALIASVGMYSFEGLRAAMSPSCILSCFPVALCFSLSQSALTRAYRLGSGAVLVQALGLTYMPLAAILSYIFFGRKYGWLDIHALVFLTLAVTIFTELRSRARNLQDSHIVIGWNILSVVIACTASLHAERVVKTKYCPGDLAQPFSVQKVWFETGSLLVAVVVQLALAAFDRAGDQNSDSLGLLWEWFEGWDAMMVAALAVRVLQAWMAGFLVQHMSTVAKAVVQSATVMVIIVVVEFVHQRRTFDLPTTLLAVIVTLSAFLYQMGRRRTTAELRAQQRARELPVRLPQPSVAAKLRHSVTVAASGRANPYQHEPDRQSVAVSFLRGEQAMAPDDFREHQQAQTTHMLTSWIASGAASSQLACVVLFILSDATRALVYGWAINGTPIVMQSIVVAVAAISIPIGTLVSFAVSGRRGLLDAACDIRLAVRCLPVAACFSVSQTLQIKAFGLGINPAVSTVLGYLYMPLSAILSRWFFGRAYSPLEWLALVQISVSATLFVLLRNSRSESTTAVGAVICVLLATLCSCMGSLGAEGLMKAQDKPFYMQKVSLEYGGLLASCCGLFIVGAVSSADADAFWKPRDVGGGDIQAGIFVGWSHRTAIALVATLVHSWLGGVVSKLLSTVVKAVAQCLSLLIVYFFGDLVLRAVPFDWVLGVAAVVVALSVRVFAVAGMKEKPPAEEAKAKADDDTFLLEESSDR